MKRITLLVVFAFMGLGLMAQNNGKGNGKAKNKNKGYSEKAAVMKSQKNGNYNDRDVRYGETNRNGKYSKNIPTRVRESFDRDFPNARNVTWTKSRGEWTAHFGGGVFNTGTRSVTYHANGTRVDNNGGIFTTNRNDRRIEPRRDRNGDVIRDSRQQNKNRGRNNK